MPSILKCQRPLGTSLNTGSRLRRKMFKKGLFGHETKKC